jgi:hypothetical protein
VIVLSAQGANPLYAAQVQSVLTKSRASIEQLIATLRKRVAGRGAITLKEKEPA